MNELVMLPVPTLVESASVVYRLTKRTRTHVTLERVTPIPAYIPPNAHRPNLVERITLAQATRLLL